MWLGTQFGQVTVSPDRPPAVTSVQNVEAPRGGSGAGDAPTEAEAIRTEPKSHTEPLTRTRDTRPAVSRSAVPLPSRSSEPSTPSVGPTSPDTPDPGTSEPEPPIESTPPPEPPVDEDPDVPPKPPTEPESEPQGKPAAGTSLA